jgi:hypothetical protein
MLLVERYESLHVASELEEDWPIERVEHTGRCVHHTGGRTSTGEPDRAVDGRHSHSRRTRIEAGLVRCGSGIFVDSRRQRLIAGRDREQHECGRQPVVKAHDVSPVIWWNSCEPPRSAIRLLSPEQVKRRSG